MNLGVSVEEIRFGVSEGLCIPLDDVDRVVGGRGIGRLRGKEGGYLGLFFMAHGCMILWWGAACHWRSYSFCLGHLLVWKIQ